jgi:hypothetical protein
MPEFRESFFIFAASLKSEQVSGRNGNICVESFHNFKGKIFGSINAIPQSIKSKSALLEKITMKSTIKLFLVVFLFSSVAFADGDMGTGGRTCPNGAPTCLVSTEPIETKETTTDTEDSILTSAGDYFNWVFEYFENQI